MEEKTLEEMKLQTAEREQAEREIKEKAFFGELEHLMKKYNFGLTEKQTVIRGQVVGCELAVLWKDE